MPRPVPEMEISLVWDAAWALEFLEYKAHVSQIKVLGNIGVFNRE